MVRIPHQDKKIIRYTSSHSLYSEGATWAPCVLWPERGTSRVFWQYTPNHLQNLAILCKKPISLQWVEIPFHRRGTAPTDHTEMWSREKAKKEKHQVWDSRQKCLLGTECCFDTKKWELTPLSSSPPPLPFRLAPGWQAQVWSTAQHHVGLK